MKRLLTALLFTGIAAYAFAQATGPSPILPTTVKWETSASTGNEIAWFVGAPDKQGIYAQRVKIPAGGRIAPHTHPDERFSIVLEGTIYVGFGETFEEAKVVAIPAGGMYVAPAGVAHFVWAKDGAATYQESGFGPTASTFIKRSH